MAASSGAAGGGPDDAQLRALALARPELAWDPRADISAARNWHASNTREQLAAGLRSESNWLEVDVRVDGSGRAVLQHDADAPIELSVEQFLSIVGPSGRGAKFDVKEREALPLVLDLARRSGIPQQRLLFNVGAWPAPMLRTIRSDFPDSIVNISPVSDGDLTGSDLAQLQVAARIVGGQVMFPLRHELVTPGVVNALRPYGRIAVWNVPGITNPGARDEAKLRAMGVDGMIDLREPTGAREYATSGAIRVAASLVGWGPIDQALEALGFF